MWDLHLQLVRHPGLRVGPIIRGDETAGRGGREERSPHLVDSHAQLSCAFAIDVHVHAWIVQRLVKLQVTKSVNVSKLHANFLSESSVCSQVRPSHINLDGSGSSKIHDLRDEVRGFKRKLTSWKFSRQRPPQVLLEFVRTDTRVWVESHAQDCFVLAARPQVNRVDGVVRRRGADIAQSGGYVSRSGGFVDRAQNLERQALRRFHAGPNRCAKTQQQLARGDSRKDLPSDEGSHQPNDQQSGHDINRNDESSISG